MHRPLTIILKTADADGRPVYIAGNFNNWDAAGSDFEMRRVTENTFEFTFPNRQNLPETIEYKYTRGGWDQRETDLHGADMDNRVIRRVAKKTMDTAQKWQQNGLAHNPAFSPVVEIISESFEIPQLIKTRRITALLPHDYYQSEKKYPVLYLQDGQNLFDDFAPFGSWGLDKRLAYMVENGWPDIIVIAIDHAEQERIKEFTPSTPTKLGVGEGEKYANFLAETLKPYVDAHYRTLPERDFTGIGGSSMGGLISIYAAMQHPELYSRLLIFSPSFWVSPDLPRRFIFHTPEFDGRIFLYGGSLEGSNMIFYLNHFREIIENDPHQRNIRLHVSVNPAGKHTETEWGRAFPEAVRWLYKEH